MNGRYASATPCSMSVLDKGNATDGYTIALSPPCGSGASLVVQNVLNDHAVGVFSGRILVKEDAQKTAAYQTNRNLCATREARMYSKPQLEFWQKRKMLARYDDRSVR